MNIGYVQYRRPLHVVITRRRLLKLWLDGSRAATGINYRDRDDIFLTKKTDLMSQPSTSKRKAADTEPTPQAFVEVIHSGAPGFGRSVYLWTTSRHYLFNAPEGLGRVLGQHQIRMGRLQNIFFTHVNWDNTGGLPGLALSLSTAGLKVVTAHGPPHVRNVFDAARPYNDQKLLFDVEESPVDIGFYEDNTLHVQYIKLKSSTPARVAEMPAIPESVLEQLQQTPKDEEDEQALDQLKEIFSKSMEPTSDRHCPEDLAVAYICTLKARPPNIDVDKLQQLNILPKDRRLLKEVINGATVTLSDGRTLERSQLVGETAPATNAFAVVECLDESYLDDLTTTTPQWTQSNLDLVVHMTPAAVMADARYQTWMDALGDGVRHMVLNEAVPNVPHFEGAYRTLVQLNSVEPNIFPDADMLRYRRTGVDECPEFSAIEPGQRIVNALPYLRFVLRPEQKFEMSDFVSSGETGGDVAFRPQAILEQVEKLPRYKEEKVMVQERLKKLQEAIDLDPELSEQKFRYPEVVFLGTASASPTRHRNITGILLNLSAEQSALLDCAEGTYSQLVCMYGADKAADILKRLRLVFISHGHQDHHLGLFTIVKRRIDAFKRDGIELGNVPPIYLLANMNIFQMHKLYCQHIEWLGKFAFTYKCAAPHDDLAALVGLRELKAVKVIHPQMAYGLTLTTVEGYKIVYSGDTRPADSLIQAGRDAYLLIHEATFEDDLQSHAVRKKHSTTREAIQVAKKMNARYTVLTHLSNRYSKLPLLTPDFDGTIAVAFDFMRFSMWEAPKLPNVLPLLRVMYQDEYQETAKRRDHRIFKRALEVEEQRLTQGGWQPPVVAPKAARKTPQ